MEENPNKGKLLGNVGGIVIKEIKYKNFRFYFVKILDENSTLKCGVVSWASKK